MRKALNDAVFGQVTELHVAKGLPWAHHGDVCAKTLHAGNVITKTGTETERSVTQSPAA